MAQEEKIVELLQKAKSGNESAFEEFILLTEDMLCREIKKMGVSENDIDDILQEVFWKIWANLEKLEVRKNPIGWIITIARNTAISFLRKHQKISFIDPAKLSYITDHNREETESVLTSQDQIKLQKLLSQLPDKHRKAIELRYFQSMSYEEIAYELKTSPANARQLVSRAIKKLKKLAEANKDE